MDLDPSLLRSHDYPYLIQRWRKVARSAQLSMRPFAEAGGSPLYFLTSRERSPEGGIYLSAGIHGDESAGTEGLLRWAEENVALLQRLPCIIIPCLNPWGLTHNIRVDSAGRDLNRMFHSDEVSEIRALKALIKPYTFALAVTLHEDYDAHGLYIYELKGTLPHWGEEFLDLARPLIPIDGRASIDGHRTTKSGLVRRLLNVKQFPFAPEAIYLHQNHSRRTFTFETPSELGIDLRMRTLKALIQSAVERTIAQSPHILAPEA